MEAVPAAEGAHRRGDLPRDRRAARGPRSGRTHRRAVQAALRRPRTERRGAARPPRHAAARRARDDGVDAGVDLPRPRPPARTAGPSAARGRRERRGLPRGRDQGIDAAASGDQQHRAAAEQAGHASAGTTCRPASSSSRRSRWCSGARRCSRRRTSSVPSASSGSNPPPGTWIPFGGGIRRCLGAALAMVEATAVLKAVLQRVDIAPGGREEWGRDAQRDDDPGARARGSSAGRADAAAAGYVQPAPSTCTRHRASRDDRQREAAAYWPPRSPSPTGVMHAGRARSAMTQSRRAPVAAGREAQHAHSR